MYKKKLINMCAVAMAVSMAFAPAATVYAEDAHTPEYTWEKNTGNVVEHTGDVVNDAHAWSTVYAEGEGTLVIQNGNATNLNDDWRAACGIDGGTVVVNGNVEGGFGAGSYQNGTAVINGDATGRAADGIRAYDDSYISVTGDIDAKNGDAIETDGSSTVIVEGDVNANTVINVKITEDIATKTQSGHTCRCGANCSAGESCTCSDRVDTYISDEGKRANLIVVEGTVTAANGVSVTLSAKADANGNKDTLGYDDIPTIIVYELPDNSIVAKSEEENISDAQLKEYLEKNIQYIVKNDSINNVVVVDGLQKTTIEKIDSINTNREATFSTTDLLTTTLEHAFTVAVREGYVLSAGDNVEVVDNGSGFYTITLKNSKGGITLSAKLIKVAAPVSNGDSYVPHDDSEETFEPFIFATFTVTDSSLPQVLGASREGGANNEVVDYASRPVVKIASGPLTAFEYKDTFIRVMKEAPQNAIVRLETSIPSCFDKMMVEALAARTDIVLEVTFPVNGEKVTTVIPAGYDVMSLLDENGYCGFLNLLAVFGNTAQN